MAGAAFNFFQTAYVVADIDSAVTRFGALYGIPRFQVNRTVQIETGMGAACCHFALAQVGDAQLELIQPAGGADSIYADMLAGRDAALHHLGCLIDDPEQWRQLQAELTAEGASTPVRGGFAGLMDYLYVDRRPALGHYLEYMFRSAAGRDLFRDVPRYPGPPAP